MKKKQPILHTTIIIWTIFLWIIFYQNIAYGKNSVVIEEKKDIPQIMVSELVLDWMEKFIQEKIKIKVDNFDLQTDSSIQRYVSDNNLLSNKQYKPSDLVSIDLEYIYTKDINPQIRFLANNGLFELSKAFFKEFNEDRLYLYSAYRSAWHQAYLIQQWCSYSQCAKVAASEHQLWLAVDIHIYTTANKIKHMWWEYYERMLNNAHLYWFTNTYRKGYNIDGKIKEPRHRRYVWLEMATYLYKRELTLAEYFKSLE